MGTTPEIMSPTSYDELMKREAREAFASHRITSAGERRWTMHRTKDDGERSIFLWVEIVALSGGSLLVHGDVDMCLFAGYHDPEGSPDGILRWIGRQRSIFHYARSKVAMGMSSQGYPDTMAREFNRAVLRWEVQERLRDRKEEMLADLLLDVESELLCDEKFEGLAIPEADKLTDEHLAIIRGEAPLGTDNPDYPWLDLLLLKLGTIEDDDDYCRAYVEALEGVEDDTAQSMVLFHRDLYDALAGYDDAGEEVDDLGVVPSRRVYVAVAAVARLCELLDEQKIDGPGIDE